MAGLSEAIEKLYSVLKEGGGAVYTEFEKIPVNRHENIYAVAGMSAIKINNGFSGSSGRYFNESYSLNIRIIAAADTPPLKLYEMLDTVLLDRLWASGYCVSSAEISAPFQDKGLRRLVLECRAEISGETEEEHDS